MHDEGIIHPGDATLRDLLEMSSVMHRHIVQQVHQIQKLQSSRSYPTANVDDLAPHRSKLHAALKTPEAHVASSGETGHRYTDSPLEVPRVGTPYDPLTLPDMIQKAWPKLTKDGARVLTAQSMGETTKAKACWNFKPGNMKASESQSRSHIHQYLPGTWEYWSASAVADYTKTDKNARYATAGEIRKHVGKESGGRKVIVFAPPDKQDVFVKADVPDTVVLSSGWVAWNSLDKQLPLHLEKTSALLQKATTSHFD